MLVKKGFSKRELSLETQLGQATIVQISNGKRNPSPSTAKKIAEVLDINFDDFFEIET